MFCIEVPDGEDMPNLKPGEFLTLLKTPDETPVQVVVDSVDGRRIYFRNITQN